MPSLPKLIPIFVMTLAFASCACDATNPPEETSSPQEQTEAPQAKPQTPRETTQEMVPIKVAPRKVKGDMKALSRSYRELLNRGRKQVRAGDFPQGINTFREALKSEPNDPRLLGELSFAALQDGQHSLAQKAARDCIRNTHDGKQRGSCYYNLGRAQEEQNNKPAAAASYQHSLAARPGNQTVQQRLESLKTAPAPAPTKACGGLPCAPASTIKGLCKRLKTDAEAKAGLATQEETFTCDVVSSRRFSKGDLKAVAVIEVAQKELSPEVFQYLAMQTDKGWMPATTVAYIYNPGAFGIYESGEVRVAVKDVIQGGAQEVVARTILQRHDVDMGIAEEEDSEVITEQICELLDGQPRCYGPVPIKYAYHRLHTDLEYLQQEGLSINPDLPIKINVSLEASYPGQGQVKIQAQTGDTTPALKPWLGTHQVRNLPQSGLDILTR